ncbi:MAG: hypothetical protein O2930_11515 [Acidobacteria bacterium]|nr:hypothetical protein [Acidobacteriota bacterium]
MTRLGICLTVLLATAVAASGQTPTPRPFPRPSTAPPPRASAPAPEPPSAEAPPAEAPPAEVLRPETPQAAQPTPAPGDPEVPTEATLGFPIYPTAQFIASYDAGRAQRYYLFGTTATYEGLIAYYRTLLDERGNQVFDEPPTYMFEVGRFRNETMAFPPGVTIKDWTWNSAGYPNQTAGAEPARYPSIIMIVPMPPGPQ